MYFCLPPQNLEVEEVEEVVEVAVLEVEPQREWAAFSKEVCQSYDQLEVKHLCYLAHTCLPQFTVFGSFCQRAVIISVSK